MFQLKRNVHLNDEIHLSICFGVQVVEYVNYQKLISNEPIPKKMKNQIPNIITLFNLLSGILSIYSFMQGDIVMASWFVFIAAGLDFLDGFAARLLNAKSEIGAQLDSLCDVVSFGVAPGFLMFYMLNESHGNPGNADGGLNILPFVAFLIPAFGALRLAIFNTDTEQTVSFKGLPIPAMAFLVASLPLIRIELYEDRDFFYMLMTNTYLMVAITVLGSLLMVSRFPMFALKFEGFGFKKNMIKYIFILLSLILLIWLKVIAIPFIILLYLFISLVIYLVDIQG